MNQHNDPHSREVHGFSGSKDHLDAATIWARALFYSALGEGPGEAAFRQIPARILMAAYSEALAQPTYH